MAHHNVTLEGQFPIEQPTALIFPYQFLNNCCDNGFPMYILPVLFFFITKGYDLLDSSQDNKKLEELRRVRIPDLKHSAYSRNVHPPETYYTCL